MAGVSGWMKLMASPLRGLAGDPRRGRRQAGELAGGPGKQLRVELVVHPWTWQVVGGPAVSGP